MIVRQICDALKMTSKVFTDLMSENGGQICEISDPGNIQQLRDINQLPGKRNWVHTTKLHSLVQLLRRMDIEKDEHGYPEIGVLIQPFSDAMTAEPPRSAAVLGRDAARTPPPAPQYPARPPPETQWNPPEHDFDDFDDHPGHFYEDGNGGDGDGSGAADSESEDAEYDDITQTVANLVVSPATQPALINVRVGRCGRCWSDQLWLKCSADAAILFRVHFTGILIYLCCLHSQAPQGTKCGTGCPTTSRAWIAVYHSRRPSSYAPCSEELPDHPRGGVSRAG